MATVRVINEFHNVDFTVIPNGDVTLSKYKTYVRRACSQKDCYCETKVYIKINSNEDADLVTHDHSIRQWWNLIDPVDLELRDRGYGVKL